MTAQTQIQAPSHSVDPNEVEQFSRIAAEWWDPNGKFKPLHQINPLRIGYIKTQIGQHFGHATDTLSPLAGLKLLDIGCGGGLICEPMARLGADVTGIDASERNIVTAALHADQSRLTIDYRATTAEALAESPVRYDVVLALEIIEHVTDPHSFIASCASLIKPGGLIVMSTINRTPHAYVKAIIGAEYLLRLLPRGTHHWQKFVRPCEMREGLIASGIQPVDATGMVLNPRRWSWELAPHDLRVNYLMVGSKPA